MSKVRFTRSFGTKDGRRYFTGDVVDLTDGDRYVRAGVAEPVDGPKPEPKWDSRKVAPSTKANKATWVAFARLSGYNPNDDLTKAELIDRYGETVA